MDNELKIGSTVRHDDNTIGHVVAIHKGDVGNRIIEWRVCFQYRASSERALTVIDPQRAFRWR
jgi:hypothetical protein